MNHFQAVEIFVEDFKTMNQRYPVAWSKWKVILQLNM